MNKIYKLKYDRRRNQVVAVSELTAGAGKESTGQVAALAGLTDMCSFRKLPGTLTPLAFLTGLVMSLLPGIALANPDLPTGGQIVAGQGSISTNGNQMTISQNTHGLVTNWNTFDVGQNHTVQFVQSDSSAVALNRVTGGHESQILGTLTANGQVMLVNPAGVMFGKGATVNTAGLVASTKNISNADFMAGHYAFSGGSDAGAEVVNQGNLTTTKGGYIVLAADRVKNSGNIRTPGGKTVLASGDKVTLQLDNTGLASVSVSGSVVNALVENSGLLSATDGRVYLTARGKDMLLNTVVNNTGTVEASGLSGHGGEIVLNGGDSGVVNQSGQLLADSHAGPGGKITVEGQNIHLAANSRTSATGKTGGGEVYVGGGWQGKDSRIVNASKVVMDGSAMVDVSATDAGNGGTAVLWSDDYTNFRGTILAKGGTQSGNGGRVETSSHQNLQAFGDVDTSASVGHSGEWLLDPLDVTIVSGGANTSVSETGKGTDAGLDSDTDHIFSPSATGAQVSAAKISEQLNNGTSVTVDTHGDGEQAGNIAVNANIIKKGGSDAILTLKAGGNIAMGDNTTAAGRTRTISSAGPGGKLGLKLLAGGTGAKGHITLGRDVDISLNGGDFYAGPVETGNVRPSVSLEFQNNGKIQAGNITMDVAGGMTGRYNSLIATDNLTVNGPVTFSTGWGANTNITAGDKLKLNAASGDITFTSTDGNAGGGKILISGKNGVDINSSKGKLSLNTSVGEKFGIDIKSDDGNISLAASPADNGTRSSVLTLNNVVVNAGKGNVSIKGISLGGMEGLTSSGLKINSGGTTELSGTSGWGVAASLSGLALVSDGNVSVKGVAPLKAWATGLKLNNSTITSTNADISLTGLSRSDPANKETGLGNALEINTSTVKAAKKIILHGTSADKTGLLVKSSNLDAAGMDVTGTAENQGAGFSFSGSHFSEPLADLTAVTFSSAGSAAGVTNSLDSSIVTEANRATLLAWHPENMTRIDMGGNAIFDDSDKADKGWVADFSSDIRPDGGWIFVNTTVTAAGTVDLKGAGFTNSTIAISDGDFRLNNAGPVILNSDTITVSNGNMDAYSHSGNVNLSGSNITAKNDINLTAYNGTLTIAGTNNVKSRIASTNGSVNIAGSSSGKNKSGVDIADAEIKAVAGIVGVTGVSDAQCSNCGDFNAGIRLAGGVSFQSLQNHLMGSNNASIGHGGAVIGLIVNRAAVTFNGNTTIDALSDNGTGLMFNSEYDSKSASLNFIDGISFVNSITKSSGLRGEHGFKYPGGMSILSYAGQDRYVPISVLNGTLNIEASGNGTDGISSYGLQGTALSSKARHAGYKFTGDGNVNIRGVSNSGNGVELRILDNSKLTGKFTVTGESKSGTGVIVTEWADVTVANAIITGTSQSGQGIHINARDTNSRQVNLNNNTLSGTSNSSAGIGINGNNVIITGGSLEGTSKGSRAGVQLTGGSNFTLAGASVTGESVDGVGVSASGNLTVNNKASITGTATGKGAVGVKVSGNLSSTGGSTIHGTALSGNGVQISGDTSLSGVTLSGDTGTGTGVNIVGNLKTDEKTTVTGNAADMGTGVSLGASLEGGSVSGTSVDGTGLQLADKATVTNSILSGSSTSGDGVAVTGKTVLDDTTAQKLHAASGSGNGLSLEDGATVSVVQTGTQTQVSAPATLTGTSGTGSGVATSGNVSISGVTLTGKTAADGGTGVALGGNLTIADDISGVSASATGNGTALKISDGVVDAKGYEKTGKTLVISATSEDGAAVSTSGNSSLISVELNGTASGNGSAVVVSGGLSTDKALTAVSTGDKGTGLQLSGGHLQSTAADNAPVKVTVSATGNGTAVAVTQPESGQSGSGLSGIDLVASADRGTVLDIGGDLTTARDISVSTENGTAISLNGGSLQGAAGDNPVTVTAQATGSGTAVTVKPSAEGKPESSLANMTLNTTSAQGNALHVGGVLNTKDVVVTADSTGTGTALSVSGGEIHSQGGTNITVMSDSGHAAVINNGKLTGNSTGDLTVTTTTKTDNPALSISGTSDISNSMVTGENSGNGSAVSVSGVVTSSGGGEIKGQTVDGTAVEIKGGTSATSSQGGGLLITATATGEKGTGVVLSNAILTGSQVNADATRGSAVTITDGSITGGNISGHATGGTGLNISNAVLSEVVASGTTQTGTGTVINGTLTSDAVSQVTGTATQDGGDGVSVSGSVTGGKVEGHATSGDAVSVADGGSVTNAEVAGDAVSGTGVNVSGKATLTNASLSGTTQTGKGAVIAGSLTADDKSVVSGEVAQDGGDGVSVSGSVTGGKVEGHATSGNAVNITGGVSHGVIFGDATQGTGVVVNSGSQVTDTAVNGSATEGTGTHWHAGVEHNNVTITGNSISETGVQMDADTSLKNVTVNGSTESGKGVDIAGALTSTGSTTIAGHSSDSGTGVDVAGDISGGSITGNATGTGIGVKVSGQEVNVSDAVVKGSADSGTGMSVTGNLTGNDSATVTGQATGNGTGVDVSGKLNGAVSGSSSSGTGIRVTDGADIAQGSHVDGHSDSGTGAVIQGSVTNQGSITGQSGSGGGTLIGGTVTGKGDITGTSKGTGEGVILAGNVTGGGIIGQSDGGTGLSISDGSTLTDVTASGNTVTGTGVHVKGELLSKDGTTVTGSSSGNGTGMLLSGNVTGGVMNGHSTDGVGVNTVRDIVLNGVAVNGTSVSHNGVQVNSHVTNTGSAVITGSSESGAGVSLNGTVSGGVLKGHSVRGPGLHVTGDSLVNGVDVSSSSEQGAAVQMDGKLSSADSSLNGQELQDTATTDTLRQAVYQQQGVISHTERQKHPAMASGYRGQDKPVSVEICTDGQCRKLEAGTLLRPVRQ